MAVSAHIDTVFAAGTKIEVRREGTKLLGPGISDNAAITISTPSPKTLLNARRLNGALFIISSKCSDIATTNNPVNAAEAPPNMTNKSIPNLFVT